MNISNPPKSKVGTVIWGMIRKDLQGFFSDRRALLISFVAPIMLAAFMGSVMGGGGQAADESIRVIVADEDQTDLTKAITKALQSEKTLKLEQTSPEAARELVRKGRVVAAVWFPKGFGEQAQQSFFGGGDVPELTLLHDPSRGTELAMLRGLMMQHAMQTIASTIFDPKIGSKLIKDQLKQIEQAKDLEPNSKKLISDIMNGVNRWMENANKNNGDGGNSNTNINIPAGFRQPFQAKEVPVTAGERIKFNNYAHSFAGMSVQFMLFTALEGALILLRERKSGLWRRVRAAPISRYVVLLSKTLSATIISSLVLAVCYFVGIIVFKIPMAGSLLGLILVLITTALSSASFGLMLAALGKTPEATRGISTFAILIMVMVGGAWIPSFTFPSFLQSVSQFTPTRWAIDGMQAMTWRGLGLADGLQTSAVLMGFSFLFGLIAWLRFQWNENA